MCLCKQADNFSCYGDKVNKHIKGNGAFLGTKTAQSFAYLIFYQKWSDVFYH